jgi:2-polyprenyl-6-methoxyphenol hydroxylase-like FAD-dependent oxidoreductase
LTSSDAGIHDVVIVGYGPVGQLLATQLGRQGHDVVVVERYTDTYPMPRAVHFDHEVARILQSVGIRSDDNPIIEPYDDWYEWRNADRQTLLRLDWSGAGPSGWHTSNFFAQPDLERALDAAARAQPTVTVRRGTEAVSMEHDHDFVTLMTRVVSAPVDAPTTALRARYVVGCDGANSTVRALAGIETTDLGFFYDWLILDMIPKGPVEFEPPAWQLCDPKRPTTIVPGGPGRRRWEFMALPGEDINELNKTETAWRLLQPWGMTPDNALLERHTVYTFQAQWAERWRLDRVLIAGDAAHLMPPFAGQGMCAGMRDAANLSWKLDLVLRGTVGDGLLDTFGPERIPHVRYFMDMSIDLGRVICVASEVDAAERDRGMIAALEDPSLGPPPPEPPRLGPGLLGDDEYAGRLSIQSRIEYLGEQGLWDDVVGRGWFVLTTQGHLPALSAGVVDLLDRIGARVLRVGPPGSSVADVVDLDGRYIEWLAEMDVDAVVLRPDFYVYAATAASRIEAVLEGLAADLTPMGSTPSMSISTPSP